MFGPVPSNVWINKNILTQPLGRTKTKFLRQNTSQAFGRNLGPNNYLCSIKVDMFKNMFGHVPSNVWTSKMFLTGRKS